MLRSAATPSRTKVQPSSEMTQTTTRCMLRRRCSPSRSAAHVQPLKPSTKQTITIRLFKG